MNATKKAPKVPLSHFKRTKIIATVGPAVHSYQLILNMIDAGANGLRFNCSHGTDAERTQQIAWVRKASHTAGKPVAILFDLQGPKIRLGDFEGIVNVQTGKELSFKYKAKLETEKHIPTQYDLSKKVHRGERMYINDGRVRLQITSVRDGIIYAKAENDGILISRKGINLPDTDFEGDIITIKDRADLAFISTHDVDYVSLSFVQNASDIHKLRRMLLNLGSSAKVIAKIETKAAVANIDQIVQAADAVMIARGDLAIETELESVPIVQRKIIGLGQKYARPTIVATQMLATMTDTPEPTRAEVSDIATAVLVGADAVMLSDETASGKYPIEAIDIMKRVILYTQENAPLKAVFDEPPSSSTRQGAISTAIITLADSIAATAIVAETKSGATALEIACRRPRLPVIAVTSDERTVNQLAVVYGVKCYLRPADKKAATILTNWLHRNKVLASGDIIVSCSGQFPGVVGTTDTIKVRVLS